MDTTDLVSSTLNRIKERINGPFYGTFFLAWSIHNWKIYVVLLSGKHTAPDRLLYINDAINSCNANDFLWIPLAATTLVVFVFSWISLGFFAFNEYVNSLFKKVRFKISKTVGLTPEEATSLQKELFALEKDLKTAQRDLTKKQKEYDLRLQSLIEENSKYAKKYSDLEKNTARVTDDSEENKKANEEFTNLPQLTSQFRDGNNIPESLWAIEMNELNDNEKMVIREDLGKTMTGVFEGSMNGYSMEVFHLFGLVDKTDHRQYTINDKGRFFLRKLTRK